jgi:hypothetical protein
LPGSLAKSPSTPPGIADTHPKRWPNTFLLAVIVCSGHMACGK